MSETTTFYREVLECDTLPDESNDLQYCLPAYAGREDVEYQAQLYDDPDVWTTPLPLTEERAAMLLMNDDVSRVKLIFKSKL